MDQEKIGHFISENRKKKKLTQEQLAEKLGVSKNAVSKWERGICLMDMSLLLPLCKILDISINELLSGEYLTKDDYQKRLEENIVNTIEYTNKKVKEKNKIIKTLISVVLLLLLSTTIIFAVDINRMRNHKEVFFSTWGFDYAPPINLDEEKIYKSIEDYLIEKEKNNSRENNDEKTFVSIKTYLIDESKNITNVYSWVVSETYYQENNQIIQDSASSIPYKFILEKNNDNYTVVSHQIPRDGSYYEKDMKKIFPRSILNDMNKVHTDGTIEKLIFDIERQKDNYYQE